MNTEKSAESDAIPNIVRTVTDLLTALDEGRYNFDEVHVRSDLNYLRAEARRALAEIAVPPGPCWNDSGVTWPGQNFSVRCELLAGHLGAHEAEGRSGGHVVWEHSTSPATVCEREYGGRHYFSIDGTCQRCGHPINSPATTIDGSGS